LKRDVDESKQIDSSSMPRPLPAFERLKDAFGENASSTATAEPYQLERLESALKHKLAAVKAEVKQKSDALTASAASVSSIQSQRKSIEEQIVGLERKLNSYRDQFAAADAARLFHAPASSLAEELSKLDKSYEQASQSAMLSSSTKFLFKKYITMASESHCCGMCARAFATDEEEKAFVAKLSNKVEKISAPEVQEKKKQQVKTIKAKIEQMQALQTALDAAQQIQAKERPALQERLTQLESELAAASRQKAAVESDLKDLRDQEDSVQDLLKNAGTVARLFLELHQMFHGLRKEETKLAAEAAAAAGAEGNGGRSLEVVVSEYEALERLNVTLQRDCNSLQEKLESGREQKQKLVDQVNKAREQIMEMNRIQLEKDRLKKEETENNTTYATIKAEVSKVVRTNMASCNLSYLA
jgi:chromosome segregation ATPase